MTRERQEPTKPNAALTAHDDIQRVLVEIGSLQRFIAEKEYPLEKEQLDVVWRKGSNPFQLTSLKFKLGRRIPCIGEVETCVRSLE